MPRFDGTGPMGQGPGTGWAMGPCGCEYRKGFGRGYGRIFGWRSFYTRKEESEVLKEEQKILEEDLKAIKERLDELKGQ